MVVVDSDEAVVDSGVAVEVVVGVVVVERTMCCCCSSTADATGRRSSGEM